MLLAQSTRLLALPGESNAESTLRISVNRKLLGAFAALFAVLVVVGTSREVSKGSIGGVLFIVLVFGGLFVFYARGFLQRGPALIVDPERLSDLRSGRVIRWSDVSNIALH